MGEVAFVLTSLYHVAPFTAKVYAVLCEWFMHASDV